MCWWSPESKLDKQAGHVVSRLLLQRQLEKEDDEGNLEQATRYRNTRQAVEREATEDKDDFWSVAVVVSTVN